VAEQIAGWKLDRTDRKALLERFPPRYADTVADHVTYGHVPLTDLPEQHDAEIIGRADDGSGLEAMVVALGGSHERPTGGTYHITWSLGPRREGIESNDVIAERGWQPICEPVRVRLEAAIWS
jgi:hypothetical protein